MIVKASKGKIREFKGVSFEVLATGKQSMVTCMKYRIDNLVPFHKHPHEQCGYVLSGRFRLKFRGKEDEIGCGDTYCIPGNVEHSIEVIEAGKVIDFFSPPREDYL